MSETSSHGSGHESTDVSPKTVAWLERLDSWAHVVVAIFFLLMATGVLIASTIVFVRQLPYLSASYTPDKEPRAEEAAKSAPPIALTGANSQGEGSSNAGATQTSISKSQAGDSSNTGQKEEDKSKSERKHVHPFIYASVELLSSLLFAVIILELLRTIITYLQSHDTQAIMKEFLIVGIISSIRKILMVGAESSLANTTGNDFIQEAIGVVISVVAILLMIGGLILLNRHFMSISEGAASKE